MDNRLGSAELSPLVDEAVIDLTPREPVIDLEPRAPARIELVPEPSRKSVAPRKTRHGEELARARAELLERVTRGEISVQEACREGGISRARFYQLRTAYHAKGVDGLRPSYPQVRHDLRLPQRVESAIVAYAILNPLHGERVISRVLADPELGGIKVSRHGVGEVLRRNGLSRREARLARAAGSNGRSTSPSAPSQGDSNWFSEIYEKYRGYVYRVCLNHLRDSSLAEDATQETFVRVYTNIGRFDSRRSILPWLKTIAINHCIDLHRRNGRVTATDPTDDEKWNDQAVDGELVDSVMTRDRRVKLEKSLSQLPMRQRRALLLHVLEGWSYTQIADAEEVSLQAVKSLVFRARANLRKAETVGLVAAVIAQLRGLRARLHRTADRFALRIEVAATGFVASIHALGGMALIGALALGTAFPVAAGNLHTTAVHSTSDVSAAVQVGAKRSLPGGEGASTDTTHNYFDHVLENAVHPGADATPENSSFGSMAVSPNYARDHTIFAAGSHYCYPMTCYVLFVSHDSGVSWTRLPAQSLAGVKIALPPAYPRDARIFAMGTTTGLQISKDGGKTFAQMTTPHGDFAISPRFNERDERILIGAPGTIMEYRPADDSINPAPLLLLPRLSSTVAFAPGSSYSLVFAGSSTPVDGSSTPTVGSSTPTGAVVDRCQSYACTRLPLPASSEPSIAFSPRFAQDGLVYAFTGKALFRLTPEADDFQSVALPGSFSASDSLTSVLVQVPPVGRPLLFVAFSSASGNDTGLYRSSDGGASWTQLTVGMRGFEFGVGVMAAPTPDQLLIAGLHGGVACSYDAGNTWSSRCRQ
jgi:RNA polymerase sigma-70 factor (ECF subfamily)